MGAFFLVVMVLLLVDLFVPFTPAGKAARRRRKYARQLRRATERARIKLAGLPERDLAAFDPYSYAISLSKEYRIRPDTALLAVENAGFPFDDPCSHRLDRLRRYISA